jgi:hypothetical protein
MTPLAQANEAAAQGPAAREELSVRESDGLTVQLLWEPDADALILSVRDGRAGTSFELPVARDRGLEAFYHPFAFADTARCAPLDPASTDPERTAQCHR